MDTIYVKSEYSAFFAELLVTEEIEGPKAQEIIGVNVSEGGVDFTVSFVERDPSQKYYRQCPMDIIIVSKHINIPRKIPDILNKLSQGLKPKEGEKANTHEELTRKEGPEYGIDFYPNALKSFLLPIGESHSSLIKRLTTILSWRCFDTQNLNVKNSRFCLLFSFDDNTWHKLPMLGSISCEYVESPAILNQNLKTPDGIINLIDKPPFDCLPVELLYEAKKVLNSSPRSSLIIAVSALETKLKGFISEKTEGSEWLINNLQSPPIDKILSDYVPCLVTNKQEYINAVQRYVPEVKNFILERNKVAHQGYDTSFIKVKRYLATIEEIMYLLDYFSGCKWATPSSRLD